LGSHEPSCHPASAIATDKALATGEREIAVLGCGALGLTSALLPQRAGARVTIYAKDLTPNVRSSLATGVRSPDSRICLEQHATRHSSDCGRAWRDVPKSSSGSTIAFEASYTIH
jgi:2-polyprenyl-6-methoxyphenol hydroxylase-like FAD-dependent oxidoreductase